MNNLHNLIIYFMILVLTLPVVSALTTENVDNSNDYGTNKTVILIIVKTTNDNTTLRLKNLNSDFSQGYKDVVTNSNKPVVMSGGIFSNLNTFEEGLGGELAQEGYDVWTIEMTGGPETECATCPDYTYDDLTTYYWPALIAGVMNYSGKNKIDYVGHSNGCRAALSSLNNYSNAGKNNAGNCFNLQTGMYDINCNVPSLPVDKFFGIACPATLNNETAFTTLARDKGTEAINKLSSKSHVTLFNYGRYILPTIPHVKIDYLKLGILYVAAGDNKISLNLMKFYNELAMNASSTINFSSVNVSKLYLHHGYTSDLIVPFEDLNRILNDVSISPENEKGLSYDTIFHLDNHMSIKDNNVLKKNIKEELKDDIN